LAANCTVTPAARTVAPIVRDEAGRTHRSTDADLCDCTTDNPACGCEPAEIVARRADLLLEQLVYEQDNDIANIEAEQTVAAATKQLTEGIG